MYVISKHKLPLLAALAALSSSVLLQVSSSTALAAGTGCAQAATAESVTPESAGFCRDQALLRDYALGLTSEPLVETPPVSLAGPPAKAAAGGANAPLSLLADGQRKSAGRPSVRTDAGAVAGSKFAPSRAPARAVPQSHSFGSLIEKTAAESKPFQSPPSAGQRRYLALGDFAVPEDASKVAQAFDLWNPRIQHVYISGRHHSRILVGPFSDREIAAVQRHLNQHGFSRSWPLRSTANATPETLIARYPGDG